MATFDDGSSCFDAVAMAGRVEEVPIIPQLLAAFVDCPLMSYFARFAAASSPGAVTEEAEGEDWFSASSRLNLFSWLTSWWW